MGDKKLLTPTLVQSNTISLGTTTYVQFTVKTRFDAGHLNIRNQALTETPKANKMKLPKWFPQLLPILVVVLLMMMKNIQAVLSLTMEEIRNKLKSAGGPSAHGIGQKVSSKDLIKFLDPGKSGIQLMEMAYVVITESTTKLAGIEEVGLRNLETAKQMYPGDIICGPKQVSCALSDDHISHFHELDSTFSWIQKLDKILGGDLLANAMGAWTSCTFQLIPDLFHGES
jgi:hypothetical protein